MTRRSLIKGVLAVFAGRGMTAWPTLEAAKASLAVPLVMDGIGRSTFSTKSHFASDLDFENYRRGYEAIYNRFMLEQPVANTGELLAQGWERGIARHAHEDPFMVKMK